MAIFSNKMVCESCGKVFVQHKGENGKNYWSCQGDSECPNQCANNIVNEDGMLEFISRRLWIGDRTPRKIQHFIDTKVEKIKVKAAYNITVDVMGDKSMLWTPPHFIY
jgi:NAD-dependent DNA ligase